MQYPLYPDQKLALSNYLFLSDILVVEDVGTDYIYYELLYIYIFIIHKFCLDFTFCCSGDDVFSSDSGVIVVVLLILDQTVQ